MAPAEAQNAAARTVRQRVNRQLDPSAWLQRGLSPTNRLLASTIIVATVVAIVQTEPDVERGRERFFAVCELVLGIVFLVEFLARWWSSAENSRHAGWRGRLRYLATPAAIIDGVVVIVSFAPMIVGSVFPLRLLRLLVIVRFAKLGRFSSAMRHLAATVRERRYELGLTGMLAGFVIVFGATAMWWTEGDVQPDKFGSIPRAMWWAAVTLTTIGYGDVYPVTTVGKILSVLVAMTGIGLIAMPTGILAAAFSDALQRDRGQ